MYLHKARHTIISYCLSPISLGITHFSGACSSMKPLTLFIDNSKYLPTRSSIIETIVDEISYPSRPARLGNYTMSQL